jgi:hypothetical protein
MSDGTGNAPERPTGETGIEDVATDDALVATVPAPVDLVAAPAPGGFTFSWSNPEAQDGDVYLWRRTSPAPAGDLAPVTEPTVAVPGTGQVCIEVYLRRSNGRVSEQPAEGCAP